MAKVWRLSLVRMYYPLTVVHPIKIKLGRKLKNKCEKVPRGETPIPICEFKAWVLLRNKPTENEEKLYKDEMMKMLDFMEKGFIGFKIGVGKYSGYLNKAINKSYIFVSKEPIKVDRIYLRKRTQRNPKTYTIEINGYEVEDICLDYFKGFLGRNPPPKFTFREIYFYACSYDVNCKIKDEFSNDEIKKFILNYQVASAL